MDPVSALAMASAAYNGIKKAVELGREAHDIFGQLGKWAEAAGNVQSYITEKETKKSSIFSSITDVNDTRAAFDILKAKEQIRFMEAEIYKMFTYGALQHLGQEGYRDFIKLRKDIKEKRERAIREQRRRRKMFFINLILGSLLVITLLAGAALFDTIYQAGVAAGKW